MYVIDRFEGDFAILVKTGNGSVIKIHRSELCDNVRENDKLVFENGSYLKIFDDTNSNKDRFDALKKRAKSSFK